ncbi:preprotein translocase subunit SecG [Candidatus Hydrogenedentota bacterium]
MLYVSLMIFYTIVCVVMVGIVLLQAGKDSGLSGAFGMGAGSDTVFGAQRGNILTKMTIVGVTIFMLMSFVLSKMTASQTNTGSGLSPLTEEVAGSPSEDGGDTSE